MDINKINDKYERDHFRNQESMVALIRRYYDNVIQQISPLIAAGAATSVINKKLDDLLSTMVNKTVTTVKTAMQNSWSVSLKKTADIFETQYKGIQLPDLVQKALDDHRTSALEQFIARKENGLNLSDRIWKTADQFKELINDKIDAGIEKGTSAYKIGKDLRTELQNPQTQSKPGQGVYKSPVKNAERVSRTENNMAYRKSDQAAWENNPLVLGYEIRLSATSKPKTRCELCRQLEGEYPVWFVWAGWHPQCLCFKIPILMSREMLNQYNRLIALGEDTPTAVAALQKGARIEQPPTALANWITGNSERVAGWKQNPYWWNDNQSFVDSLVKAA